MTFPSATFLVFLGLVFAMHWAGRSRGWQNAVLLAASVWFYAWWDWRFCGLMLGSATVDYVLGQRLAAATQPRSRRWLLGVSLGFNLGLLAAFKYFGFFADSLALLLAGMGVEVSWVVPQVILPVGISFYTFQTLSYTLDIYRGEFRPQRDFLSYLTFVCFFPQLVAGPIERASHLLPQFLAPRRFDEASAREGCRFILWGLAKKLLLADNLAPLVSGPFASPTSSSPAALALATLAFAFQIYGDFSAYSDIAVGTARLFGVELMRNFAYPYFSASLTDFWRRWHISMSTWFRDYVYVPLGGNRGSAAQTYRNLFLTTFLSGLWHGAAWHFVLWGLLHGAGLAVERALGWRGPRSSSRRMVQGLATFTWVNVAWVMFRAESVGDAWTIYSRIGAGVFEGTIFADFVALATEHRGPVLGVLVLLSLEAWKSERWHPLAVESWPVVARWVAYTSLIWITLLFGARRVADFIYFQF